MLKPHKTPRSLAASPVYLAASAINSVIHPVPAGTAYCIGIVLLTMFTGPLLSPQGSLARAALPYVLPVRWGWHRVERALERGKVALDGLCARACSWCLAYLVATNLFRPLFRGVAK
jgi:hypothetical protein